jgi:mRNA interferase MazF
VRGAVYRLNPGKTRGHEQSGPRFGVVAQSTRLEHLSTWLVIPTTTSESGWQTSLLRPPVDWGRGESFALCAQMKALDPEQRLGDHVGYLPLNQVQAVDHALRFLLDLP